jgi:lipopolysaccharide/colanic/teichoic acid biosynthesis glycosyltransferase
MRSPRSKRLFDVTVSALLLLLLSPVFGVAFVVIGLDMLLVRADRGPWLYRERRISAGREFDVLKFRVLRVDAIRSIEAGSYARLLERDLDNLTRAGRFLKIAYLDELPQLVNVLRGDMSIVGPRPWPISMVEQQRQDGYRYRDEVVAGWTGPAQIRKDQPRKSYSALDLDLEYVEALRTWSGPQLVRHDLRVLWASLRTAARGRGLQY